MNPKPCDLLGASLGLRRRILIWFRLEKIGFGSDLDLILVSFGFGYRFVQVAIKNLREEKLINALPNPNLFVRFVKI